MNIDIIKVSNQAYRLYRDILKGHGLSQHVIQPIRNDHALLDHITTNIPSRVKHTGHLYNVLKLATTTVHTLSLLRSRNRSNHATRL